MRYIELVSGWRIPISEEEQSLVNMISESDSGALANSSLDEVQQEIARLMVSRGVIKQTVNDDDLIFTLDNERLDRF
jgi:hypothetical protein